MAGDYFSSETIAAIATSLAGNGGVGIIRLSGGEALSATRLISRGLENPQPRYLHRIEVLDSESGGVLDDGLGVYFPEGQSFTGEEVVELQLHGGRLLLQSILKRLIDTGRCRLALPGEFSFRAVRNGKLTLGGAEALCQLIGARSAFEIQAVRRNIAKARCQEFDEIAASLRELLAKTELSIDFIDQDIEVVSAGGIKAEVLTLASRVDSLVSQMNAARRIARGIPVTLVGAPNAGKSTLFNAILAEERAIVSDQAGTTRDVITEDVHLGPYVVRIADTAGIHEATGKVESEGVARTMALLEDSEIVVIVFDGTALTEQCEFAFKTSNGPSVVTVLNKWDLLCEQARRRARAVASAFGFPFVPVSAKTGTGVAELLVALRKTLDARLGSGLQTFLPTEFQLQMLVKCRHELGELLELIELHGVSHPELISGRLRSALRSISDLVGETTPDAVLAKIFGEFCIGK